DDKHNAAVQHDGPGEVGQRKENQQDRIAQGVKSGQLTAGETAKLEKRNRASTVKRRGCERPTAASSRARTSVTQHLQQEAQRPPAVRRTR
ncbi:MAG TPA: hypothetical protein VGG58_09680, partial [Candidatus Acidoferrum sp.]